MMTQLYKKTDSSRMNAKNICYKSGWWGGNKISIKTLVLIFDNVASIPMYQSIVIKT